MVVVVVVVVVSMVGGGRWGWLVAGGRVDSAWWGAWRQDIIYFLIVRVEQFFAC